MTDEHLLEVVKMVLMNDEKVDALSRIVANLVERQIARGDDFEGRGLAILSALEQLAAHDESSKALKEQLRKLAGL